MQFFLIIPHSNFKYQLFITRRDDLKGCNREKWYYRAPSFEKKKKTPDLTMLLASKLKISFIKRRVSFSISVGKFLLCFQYSRFPRTLVVSLIFEYLVLKICGNTWRVFGSSALVCHTNLPGLIFKAWS